MLKMPRTLSLLMILIAAPVAAVPDDVPQRTLAGFGQAVAVGPNHIVVGEPAGFRFPGTVHVYMQAEGGEWSHVQSLRAENAHVGDGFGRLISLAGGTLAIASDVAVTVYEASAATGRFGLAGSFSVTGTSRIVSLGSSASSVAAAGNERDGDDSFVMLYRRSSESGSWSLSHVLEPEDGDSGFGAAVSLAGDDRLAVGIPGSDAVAVYEYTAADNQWMRIATAQLQGEDFEMSGGLGTTLKWSGDRMLVGARGAQGLGYAAVFWHNGSEWVSEGRLTPPELADRMQFGSTLAFAGSVAWVGAPFAGRGVGSVFRYESTGEGAGPFTWTLAQTIAPEDESAVIRFGATVAASETLAAVGVPGRAYGEGSVDLLTEASGWTVESELFQASASMASIQGDQIDCAQGQAAGYRCGQVDLMAFVPNQEMDMGRGVRLSDVWGWTDPESGTEYALVGHLEGTVFIDLSNPGMPRYLGTLPRTERSPGSTWRDIKVYNNHAFIVADGAREHGMQVFDLTQLRDVAEPVTFSASAHYDGIHSAHNIVINEAAGYAYAVGASGGAQTCGGGLHMINIQDPLQPVFAGCFADNSTGRRGTGYSHDAQCVIYHGPDSAYAGKEICIGANETAISIADVTDKDHPIAIGTGSYPDASYVHQGWLTEDHTFFYQNDELDEISGTVDRTRTLVWDVRDLSDPVMVKEFFGPTSATDHNLYVHGDVMYQTNNASGLRLIDVSVPDAPVEIGFFDTTPYGTDEAGFNGTWSSYPYFESGIIVVTSRREGLFILKRQSVDL